MATVLVLDDDEGVGLMLCEVITDLGHQCLRAQDIEDVSQSLRVDVVITDLVTVRVYNRAAAAAWIAGLRQRFRGIPVLLLTAHAQAVADADFFAPAYVMGKPFEIDGLAAAVNDLIERSADSGRPSA